MVDFLTTDMIPDKAQTLFRRAHSAKNFNFRLPSPYADWQRELMSSKCRLIMTLNGTKTGKTLGGSGRIAAFSFQCQKEQAGLYRLVAPTYPLSEITYKYLQRLLPPHLPYQKNLTRRENDIAASLYESWRPDRTPSRRRMEWPHNGAVIQCIHGQDPETTIEGERTHGNLLDEASKMQKQVFASVLSTTSQTGGWIAITTTPRGRKHWTGQLFMEIRDHMRWCELNGKPYERLAFQVPTWTSPYVDKTVIEYARKTLPERIFAQLYGAELVDQGSVFNGHMELISGDPIMFMNGREEWTAADSAQLEVVGGVDWARRGDYTVATFWTLESRPRMVGFIRLNGTTYREIIAEVARLANSFKKVHLVRHDRTGIGDVIDELVRELPFAIDGVVFTAESKSHMVQTLMFGFQEQSLALPNWPGMIDELDNFGVTSTKLGHFKFEAEIGHDDIVCSIMLGYSAAAEMVGSVRQVLTLDDFDTSGSGIIYEDDDF